MCFVSCCGLRSAVSGPGALLLTVQQIFMIFLWGGFFFFHAFFFLLLVFSAGNSTVVPLTQSQHRGKWFTENHKKLSALHLL